MNIINFQTAPIILIHPVQRIWLRAYSYSDLRIYKGCFLWVLNKFSQLVSVVSGWWARWIGERTDGNVYVYDTILKKERVSGLWYDLMILVSYDEYAVSIVLYVKVKHSHYRPGEAQRVPGGWGSQISRQSAYEGGEVVSPTHRPPIPLRKYSWYPFLLEAESTPGPIMRPEGLCQCKIPVTPLGIETATFRLVAQCLNQLRHLVAPVC